MTFFIIMKYSVKLVTGELYHKTDYQPFYEVIYKISDLRKSEQLLLELKLLSEVKLFVTIIKLNTLIKGTLIYLEETVVILQVFTKSL